MDKVRLFSVMKIGIKTSEAEEKGSKTTLKISL